MKVLEDIKVNMEEEAKEAEKFRVEVKTNIEIKDELIGQLEDEKQKARKEAEQASEQRKSLVELNAALE